MKQEQFGVVAICAEILMLIAFFFLPNLSIGIMGFGRSLTGWEAVGFDPAMGSASHGLLSLLAIMMLPTPLVAAFVKAGWTRWLYGLPLTLVAIATVHFASLVGQVSRGMDSMAGAAAGQALRQSMGSMFSVDLGAYLVMACAIVLATQTFRKPRA